jgi:hypothetical protein
LSIPLGAKYPGRVVERDLATVKPHPRNPKVHSEEQIQELCEKITKYGYAKISIVIQTSTDYILAGHGVVESLLRLGIHKVLVYEVDIPDGVAEAFMVADNKLAEMSNWDAEQLKELIFDIVELPDVELEDTAFTEDEIEALMVDDTDAGELQGFGDFGDPTGGASDDEFVAFKFGMYSGRVAKAIYDSFIEKYQEIQETHEEVTLDDVLRRWFDV